jgi:hypothetical protein
MNPTDRYWTNPSYRAGYDAYCAGEPRDRERNIDWLAGYDAARRDSDKGDRQ